MADRIPSSGPRYFQQKLTTKKTKPASTSLSLPRTTATKTATATTVVLTTKMIAPTSEPVMEDLGNRITIQPSFAMSRNVQNNNQNLYPKEEYINSNLATMMMQRNDAKSQTTRKAGIKLIIINL